MAGMAQDAGQAPKENYMCPAQPIQQQGYAAPSITPLHRPVHPGLDLHKAAVRNAELQAAEEKANAAEHEMLNLAQDLSLQDHQAHAAAKEEEELHRALELSMASAHEGEEEAFQQSLHEARLRSLDQYASDLHRHYRQEGHGSVAGASDPQSRR